MIDTVVMIYDQAFISGGAGKIAVNEAVALKKRGLRVIFFSAIYPIDKYLTDNGVEVVCIGGEHIAQTKSVKTLLRGIYNGYAKKQLCKVLSDLEQSRTVVHIHGFTKALSSSIFLACKKYSIRTFVTLHEYFTVCPNGGLYNYVKGEICSLKPCSAKCFFCNCDKRSYFQKMYRNVRQMFQNRILKITMPEIIYITEFSRNILQKNIKFSKNSHYVENYIEAVDTEKVDVKDNSDYIFVGRLTDEKAPDLFCRAVTKSGVKGVVIGDGEMFQSLKEKYPDIEFTGWLNSEQMKKYLDRARCMIVTSKLYETMGLTIIEMQSKGIPCIVPDRCAGVEYIEDKVTGVEYKIGNIDSLISAINYTKNNSVIDKISKNFYCSKDTKRFSMDTHINNLIKVYNS